DAAVDLVRAITQLKPPEPLSALALEELLGNGGVDAVLEEVVVRWQPLAGEHDVIVVEGLNPGSTQIYSSRVNQAMAKALDADVVLVTTVPSAGGHEFDLPAFDHAAAQAEMLDHLADGLAITSATYESGEHSRTVGCLVTRVPADGSL